MPDDWIGPPDDAYGRVTNPERYRPLHDAADRQLDELEHTYAVARAEGLPLDDFGGRVELVRVVPLTPTSGDGSPLTVGYTTFPGLIVRLGRWHLPAFPHCGCDACDEQLDQLVAELRDQVQGLVDGKFSETLTPDWKLMHDYVGRSRGWTRLTPEQAAELGEPAHLEWGLWPKRRG
jgi:hypothetical protein